MFWKKLTPDQQRETVFRALNENISYHDGHVLGVPGSFLDREVFPDAPFLREAPFLRCLLENPNHIGCHTLGDFEPAFRGTQDIERELMRICAVEVLGAGPDGYDGYVATGGTEANLEALWIYRNLFRTELGCGARDVAVLHSTDTHYSVAKGTNILDLIDLPVEVDETTRAMTNDALDTALELATSQGVKAIIVVLNMGTTMFGSVDGVEPVIAALERHGFPYKVHVDAAFGGFIYPFTQPDRAHSFRDPRISSFTLDAHKMLQAPYGTGIFVARKGLVGYVRTAEARYVPGSDYTMCGSRSGANAVAVWMILTAYGSDGGRAFVRELEERTTRLCTHLDGLGLRYFREPGMNVVTIAASGVPDAVAHRFQLVPDRHDGAPQWWKIVVMDHVNDQVLSEFLDALQRGDNLSSS